MVTTRGFPALILGLVLAGHVQAASFSVGKNATMAQALDDLAVALANHDMVPVKMQPIDRALIKKGYEDPQLRILFVGSATAVRWAEAAEPRLLNLLPLRLTLVQNGERVTVMTDDFTPWEQAFPDDPGRSMLKAWEIELKSVLEDFAQQ
jgi:hypothetical protein